MKKMADLYEAETGEKATYRRNSSDFHTFRYVKWLEDRIHQPEDSVVSRRILCVKNVRKKTHVMVWDNGIIPKPY